MSPKVLVAYATKRGATAGIAAVVAAELARSGLTVDVHEVSAVDAVSEYDAVVLGSAIYLRRWQPEAVRFLRVHEPQLRERPVWLFHSGPVGPDEDPEEALPAPVARLARRIGAAPARTFAGELQPEAADTFLAHRLALTDLAGDFRDFDAVRAWAATIATSLRERRHERLVTGVDR